MNENERKWMKMNENEWIWMKMNENEWKWMKMNENEWKWTKMYKMKVSSLLPSLKNPDFNVRQGRRQLLSSDVGTYVYVRGYI